ncbi:MAG: penicillin acylase family protein [Desulfarculaceae bacterium]|nr:penicillin acylase family protein [Desulfarculaceae bacterium]MCF8074275.1 penicillin acylase family protein [Desulfarculaceae bacterium]MCF8102966.1 penicillin acylase family protein [Desulfarculaceae bacterium]MCF8117097.1 penicillin acylase family protein [Desulfarculaceae bacterium]
MRKLLKWLAALVALVILLGLGLWWYLPRLNTPQTQGALALPGLKAPVKVVRDAKGMAYIHAADFDDLCLAHGFVTAQDRLFQMEVIRRLATGRICELAGEKARPLAMYFLTLGFRRNAERMAQKLTPDSRRFLQKYIDGVNHFIAARKDEYPLEFKLAGIEPTPWGVADSLAVQLFMTWGSSGNLKTEVAAQLMVDKLGLKRAQEIFPLTINPEEPGPPTSAPAPRSATRLNLAGDSRLPLLLGSGTLGLSSNNWVSGPGLSAGNKPILANDPHLDARILPGPWYPVGLITPQQRWVGVGVPGIPGVVVGRNRQVAWGVTNAYGDCQDLYVETLDPANPDNYLENGKPVPFQVVEETLNIKDSEAPGGMRREKVKIRLSKRGPVVSGILGVKTDKVLTLRWAPLEAFDGRLGLGKAMQATSARQFRDAIQGMRHFVLNYVFADTAGDFGWVVIGGLPIRGPGQGTVPYVVTSGQDNWLGWVPDNQMPQALNPAKGWIGTCNHKTITKDYPYYYSSRLAPSWRYRRLMQLMAAPGKKSAADHWAYQRDDKNLMAELLAPILAKALAHDPETRALAVLLENWDHRDRADQAAPLVFQAVYSRLALLTYRDELGEDLARFMLDQYYFWKERLADKVVNQPGWAWFDDIATPDPEGRDQLIRQAGREVLAEIGGDPRDWRWGEVHTLDLVSPVARKGFLAPLLGEFHPQGGSESTLLRGIYDFNKPYKVVIFDSLRMVADLADDDKVWAVLPGGVTARLFNPHTTDQVGPYMSGQPLYWWFSDEAITAHAVSELELQPAAK